MGIYMLNKRVLDFIPKTKFGFDSLMLKLLDLGKKLEWKNLKVIGLI